MPLIELTVTPRDPRAQGDLDTAQAHVLKVLCAIPGVRWHYNDPGARAVIISLPADQVAPARDLLRTWYMVDPNAGLTQL